MRVAVASFEFEGNSLSLRVARRADFARLGIFEGPQVLEIARGKQLALTGGIDALTEAGAEIVPIYAARCVPGGHVEDSYFEEAKAAIVEGLAAAGPLDGIYLALHGAMICATEKDPEGALLKAIRDRLGAGPKIAVSFDLHAHVTPLQTDCAQIIVGYETYPHVDAYRTGHCAADLLARALKGRIDPVTRIAKYNAIVPVLGGATLGDAPMAHVAAHARSLEAQGRALSVSYFPVQPWLDMADVGITGLAVTDGDPQAAETVALEILDDIWDRREAFELPSMSPEQAVEAALARPGRTLIVDAPDSMGAGASGDSPALLAAVLEKAPDTPAALYIVDAETAAQAFELGAGAEAAFKVGAKTDSRWHAPVPLTAAVERLCDGVFTYQGGPAAGARGNLGPTAVLRVGGLRLVVGTYPFYEHMDEHYAACGVDVARMKLVSFKNLMNYRKLLGEGTDFIALRGPGGAPLRLQDVDWKNRIRPYWPQQDLDPPTRLV